MTNPNFTEWLRSTGQLGPQQTWVLARRTANMERRYGADTLFLTEKRYKELDEQHRVLLRDELLDRLWFDNGAPNGVRDLMTEAYELGRGKR